jgi:hypothetical protein
MEYDLPVREPGWLALRIPLDAGKNELDGALFAHTSPIYIHLAGKRIFQPDVARGLIDEMEQNVKEIQAKGVFANDRERDAVMQVYRDGIETLRRRIAEAETAATKKSGS